MPLVKVKNPKLRSALALAPAVVRGISTQVKSHPKLATVLAAIATILSILFGQGVLPL